MEPLIKCGEIKSHGQLVNLTHDNMLNLVVSIWDEKDVTEHHSTTVRVIDINSGNLVSQATFKNSNKRTVSCAYHPFLDKLCLTDGTALSVRRDTNGRFLLASVFSCPVATSSDEVTLELLLPHAVQLKDVIDVATANAQGVTTTSSSSSNEATFSSRKLNFSLIGSQLQDLLSQATPETSSVVLKLRQSTFCTLLYWLMNILGDSMHCGNHLRNRILSSAPTPPLQSGGDSGLGGGKSSSATSKSPIQQPHGLLPVVSSLYLQAIMQLSDPYNEIPKEHMFAEVFRYETFLEWPHIDYEWAGPSSMALAGFYYQPACRAEDRAVCFQCGVSLVSWEPTDEPWSEHERHAPACPMVTGDITSNVPLAESESFEPAQLVFPSPRFSPTGEEGSENVAEALERVHKTYMLTSSSDGLVMTATSSGNVVLWDATRRLRRCATFYLISDIKSQQVVPNYKEKAFYSCFCLPDVSHFDGTENEQQDNRSQNNRKSSLSIKKNGSEDEYVRIVVGGSFGDQGELHVLEFVLEPPLWAESRCQTEGARSGAQPPFTSSSSAPMNDQFNLLHYDMWDDDSPPYEEETQSPDEDDEKQLEQQVENAAIQVISEEENNSMPGSAAPKQQAAGPTSNSSSTSSTNEIISEQKVLDLDLVVPPPNEMEVQTPEPSVPAVRQVFITKQQPSGGTEPVVAKRIIKLPEIFQNEKAYEVSAIHHVNSNVVSVQKLIVVLNDAQFSHQDPMSHECWACNNDSCTKESEPKIGGVVVYKFKPSIRRGGATSSVTFEHQNFDQPMGIYTIPAFLQSQMVQKMPTFLMETEQKHAYCCFLLNLLPGANAIAVYAISSVNECFSGVTSLNPLTTLSLVQDDVIDTGHVTHFVYCPDIDTISAGSCRSRMSFWKKIQSPSQTEESLIKSAAKSPQVAALKSPERINVQDIMEIQSLLVDIGTVRHLLKVSNAVRLDQRYTITCPNGWSEMASDQASRMHPGGPGTDLSPTRGAGGPNPPTRSFVRHGSCMRDTCDVSASNQTIMGADSSFYASFDIAFTHSLHVSHVVASFGFDPLDCSLEDCKVYLLRQKDAWGAVKFGNLRPNAATNSTPRPGLHALQMGFDFGSYEILCGPVEVSQFVLRNEQPGTSNSPSGHLKAVVMLTSPELITSSSRSLTVLVEYSASSVALAAAYNQQQHILSEAGSSVLGSTTPPPPSVGPPAISATLSLTPMYLPKYKQVQTSQVKRHLLNGSSVDLPDFLFNEECQINFFDLLLSFATQNSAGNNFESQANVLDTLSLLSWLLSVSQTEISGTTFPRILSKVIENFDIIFKIAFIQPATSSRDAATVLSEIVLLITDACRRGKIASVGPVVERFFDGIFLDSMTSQITSPTIMHLFFKLASRLAEIQLVSSNSALPVHGFSKLAALGEILSVQTHVEHVQLVSGDSLTASSRIFDFPLPNHLLDTFVRPSYAAVVAGLFGPGPTFSNPSNLDTSKNDNPWSTISPYSLAMTGFGQKPGQNQQQSSKTGPDPSGDVSSGNNGGNGDVAYASGPRHIFGLIEYECLHFRFHKFCQGARAGSPRSGFKVAPPPSIRLPISSLGSTGIDPSWQQIPQVGPPSTSTQPILPMVQSYFPTLAEANNAFGGNPFGPVEGSGAANKNKTQGSGLMFTVDEVPTSDEVPMASNVPISVIYVANQSSAPPTPKPTPYITPSVTPPNELSSSAVISSILPGPVSVPSQLQSGGTGNAQDAASLGHNFDYLTNLLVLDYCNNWVAFDRSSASSRRFVDLDFGRPVVLTGFIIPVNADVLSVAVDVWLKPDDDKHHRAKRICTHMRLRQEPLIMLNLQPAPICRFVRLWTFFAVGATQGRLSMCVGQYYGYSLLSACRLSSLATISNLIGPSLNLQPASIGSTCNTLVSLHNSVLQTCIEDQLYRFREAMTDLNTISQVYASPSHMATLWTSGQRAIETRLRVCVGGAFVWRCQLNHCHNLAAEIRSLISCSQNDLFTEQQEPLDKLQLIFYYLLRMFYVQAKLGLQVKITVQDASRLFSAVCLFASEELRSAVGSLIVHFAAEVDWWPEFFSSGLRKLFASPLFSPDISSLNSNPNSLSLGDYCNLFILLIEANLDQATCVVVSMLEKLRTSLQSEKALFDPSNVGMVLFVSICLDALLSTNHWMADLWSFAPGSLASVKAQWNSSQGSNANSSNQHNLNQSSTNLMQQMRSGGSLTRRGAVYKKKVTSKLSSKLFALSSLAKQQGEHVRFNISADERMLLPSFFGEDDTVTSGSEKPAAQQPQAASILTRLPFDLCKSVTESLLGFVLESHHQRVASSLGSTVQLSMVFADVHALKLATYLSCFANPELTLSQIFASKTESLAELLDLVIYLKDVAYFAGDSSVEATRAAIRAHAAECFLKTVLLAEKIARKTSSAANNANKDSAEEPSQQGPFASLFATIKEQEEAAPQNGTEDIFNRFFALLHATRCHQISQKSLLLGKSHKCKAAECQPAKKLLEHWRQCNDATNCTYKHCVPLRLLVNHWRTCKRFDVCAPCKELAKFPLVFEPTVMNSIESVAECPSLPDDGTGIVPPPEMDPTVICTSLNDLLMSDESETGLPLDICFVDDYFDEVPQPPPNFTSSSPTASPSASSPPLPPFAFDCRYDFSLLHHSKYLLGCLQARNYADISNLPQLTGQKRVQKEEKPREIIETSGETSVLETSNLIFQSLSRCLTSSLSKSLSSLARCCEIVDDLLPYTKLTNGKANSELARQHEACLVSWYRSIISAILRAPEAVRTLKHTFEDVLSLNTLFLETCNVLMSKASGSVMAASVIELFANRAQFSQFLSAVLIISDPAPQFASSSSREYGPTFCQTFISFLRGVLEICIEQMSEVGTNVANCLCAIVSHFVDAQLLVGASSAWLPGDIVAAIIPFLVEMGKSLQQIFTLNTAENKFEWVRLGSNLVRIIALTCSMLPRTEATLRCRLSSSTSSGLSQPSAPLSSKGRGRGRGGLYAHRWDECPRTSQTAGDVVVMRMPPSNADMVKCAYPETATAYGALLSDELALLEQILSKEALFSEILDKGTSFSSLLSVLYWNGICCQSASGLAAPDSSSTICAIDSQQLAMSAFGSPAYKTCQNIFNLLVEHFSQHVGPLLLNSICPSADSSIVVGWDTRSAALVIIQAVLDRFPNVASTHRDIICEILFACFEEMISPDKLLQKPRTCSSGNKIFDLSSLARVVPGSVNLPLANLISQQYQPGSSSSAFTSSRSQRLLYELVNASAKSGASSSTTAPCPIDFTSLVTDPRPVPIPTAQRGQSGRAPAICGYTFAPAEDHFSFAVHFSVPVVLAEVVIGCDLSHSRGHLPQAVEVEVKSDRQASSGGGSSGPISPSLPLRFCSISSPKSAKDCIAVGINPPRVASSALISVYKPKSANVLYLNAISVRGFPLTSGPGCQPQMLAEVERISSTLSSSVAGPIAALPLSSSEVTFLSLLHSVTTVGKLRLLSTMQQDVSGLIRLAGCSAMALLAPSNVITPTVLQNLLEMINICVDSWQDENRAAQFVSLIVDVYMNTMASRAKPPTSEVMTPSGLPMSVEVSPFCLFVYSLAHWRNNLISRELMDQLAVHILALMEHSDNWQTFDICLLPIIQCLAYLIWHHEKTVLNEEKQEQLVQLFDQAVRLAQEGPIPYWPTPVQALICAIFNHRSIKFEQLAQRFISIYVPTIERLELQRYDLTKASLCLQPLVNVFMSPRCLDWLLTESSTLVQDVVRLVGTPSPGPISACALGFATALCRSNAGCDFVAHHLTDQDWQQLLQNTVQPACDFRYQDLVLTFFTSATLTNVKSQMRLGAAFAALLRNNKNSITGSMPCFMRAFCNRLLLADSEIAFYTTPDFDDPSTIIVDTDIVPFAGFPASCLSEFVPPAFSASVRLSGPGRCILIDLMTRSKRHHQMATADSNGNDDSVATKAAKMLKIASIAKRRTSKDPADGDQAEELKAIGSLRDLCTKFAQEGGLERDAVSSSIAWRPPSRWLIKKFYLTPRKQGDQAVPPGRSVRSLLIASHHQQETDSLSSFYSTPLLEISGFAALPTQESVLAGASGSGTGSGSETTTVPHILSAFAQVGGLDALALFFPLPNSSSAVTSTTNIQSSVQSAVEQLPTTVSSVMAALMDPTGGAGADLPDDWVDIPDVDSDSTIEFAAPKNVIVLGGGSSGFNASSLLGSTASSLVLNSAGSLMLAQQFFLPISALALRVFSRLPDLANLLTSVSCLPLTQAALRLALGLGVDLAQLQQGCSAVPSGQSSSGGIVKAMGLLPALPFLALDEFLCSSTEALPSCLEAGCVDLLLAAMHVLARQQDNSCAQSNPFVSLLLGTSSTGSNANFLSKRATSDWDELSGGLSQLNSGTQHWAKGTGFGSGPTSVNQSFDSRFSMARQRQEEQLLTLCFRLISRFVSSTKLTEVPGIERMFSLISHSCFITILSSYLQNDSIMDVSRHLLLYESALNLWSVLVDEELVRGRHLGLLESCGQMTSHLASFEDRLAAYVGTLRVITAASSTPTASSTANNNETTSSSNTGGGGVIIVEQAAGQRSSTPESDLDPLLAAVRRAQKSNERLINAAEKTANEQLGSASGEVVETASENATSEETLLSIESRYSTALKSMQFRPWQLVAVSGTSGACQTFAAKVPYHFVGNMSVAGFSSSASRARRIAQETVSLRSSLPLSLSSSVFVVVDEARLDVIKVLITGPSDTPYANGCFEFDISLPGDYPASPPLVHLCTTGNGQVRFNPNLYNDGKVCLSVLNTWHGRPEEKWNPQTSSLLQVLVSIQSLILVSEPYFNEPGYERSRGSPAARIASAEYSAEIMAQTLKWAVVEQLRRPSPCFTDVIRRHFAIKKNELLAQCDSWIELVKSMGTDTTTTGTGVTSSGATSAATGTGGIGASEIVASSIFSSPSTASIAPGPGPVTGGPSGSADVVLIGSSGRRFQQIYFALRRGVDQVRDELKSLDSLVKLGDVFGDKQQQP